jgi:hypothetical protein
MPIGASKMRVSALADYDYSAPSTWPVSGREPPDFCSREGALALKEKIEAYWRERGHSVMVSLQNVGFHPAIRAARYDLRTDMVNGMPRSVSATKKSAAAAPVRLVEPEPAWADEDEGDEF